MKSTLNGSMTEAFQKALSGELTPKDARELGADISHSAMGLLLLLVEALDNPSPMYNREDLMRGVLAIAEVFDLARAVSEQEMI